VQFSPHRSFAPSFISEIPATHISSCVNEEGNVGTATHRSQQDLTKYLTSFLSSLQYCHACWLMGEISALPKLGHRYFLIITLLSCDRRFNGFFEQYK
jgi:hypothetical protein